MTFIRLFLMCRRKGWTVANAVSTAWKVSRNA